MQTSVLIAAGIGFLIGLPTSLLMAFVMSLVLALWVWAITGFRLGASESEENQASKTSEISPAKISLHEIGVGLAVMLDNSCPPSSISQEERHLLEDMELSIANYQQEIIALCATAQECAVFSADISPGAREEILHAYRKAWENLKNASSKGAATYNLFQRRRPTYLAAFKEDTQPVMKGVIGSKVEFAFGDAISQSNSDSMMKIGASALLSAIRANASFWAHVESSKAAIEKHVH